MQRSNIAPMVVDRAFERRQSRRRSFVSSAMLSIPHRHALLYRTLELGEDGLSLVGSVGLIAHARGIVQFCVPVAGARVVRVEVPAIVTNRRRYGPDDGCRLGLMFEEVHADARTMIVDFLRSGATVLLARPEMAGG